MNDLIEGWPIIARMTARLADFRKVFRPLRDFSDECVRGDRRSGTLFLTYSHEMSVVPNPRFGEEWAAVLDRRRADPEAARGAIEEPRAVRRTFGEHGLRLELRFDRGAARRLFPMLSVCDFGDSQISVMLVEGPPTSAFRELEDALWGLVYAEARRTEFETERR